MSSQATVSCMLNFKFLFVWLPVFVAIVLMITQKWLLRWLVVNLKRKGNLWMDWNRCFFIVSVFLFNNIIKSNDHVYTHLVNLFTITANERHESKAKYSEYNRHSIFRAFLAERKCAFYMGKYGINFVIAWENKHSMFNLHQFQVSWLP